MLLAGGGAGRSATHARRGTDAGRHRPCGGRVCPFGLANPLPILADRSLLAYPSASSPAAGSRTSSLEVEPGRLVMLVGANGPRSASFPIERGVMKCETPPRDRGAAQAAVAGDRYFARRPGPRLVGHDRCASTARTGQWRKDRRARRRCSNAMASMHSCCPNRRPARHWVGKGA